MSRTTATREKVRALAQKITEEGGVPSPTVIRKLLGGGSPNTIVDELRAWQAAQGETDKVREPQKQNHPELSQPGSETPAGAGGASALHQGLSALSKQVAELQSGLVAARAESQATLEKLVARFDGVQRHMLMQVNEAREEAVRWRQRHQTLSTEFGVWQTSMRQKTEQLSSENSWLRGRLREPQVQSVPARPPAREDPAPPTRQDQFYSGHPRVRIGPRYDEDSELDGRSE